MAANDTDGAAKTAAEPVMAVVAGRFEISTGSPCPELSGPTVAAFHARDREHEDRPYVALVVDPRLPVREGVIGQLEKLQHSVVLPPIFRAVAPWPPAGGDRLVVMVQSPPGSRLAPPLPEGFTPFGPDQVLSEVVRPMRRVLETLSLQGIVHRAIRADTLFYGAEGAGSLMLGECYCSPAGYTQPALYEPIERAMTPPAGRGEGTQADDMYALGVALSVLLQGRDPSSGLSDDEMLDMRIAKGSYLALFRDHDPHPTIQPILRALLEDDGDLRWTVKDLARFIDQSWVGSRPPRRERRSSVPFSFKGHTYHAPRPLARAFAQHWSAALEATRTPSFEDWLKRGLGEAERLPLLAVSEVGSGARPTAAQSADLKLARLLIFLDADGPIRLKEFSAQPDGFGPALADATRTPGVARDATQVVDGKLVEFWSTLNQKRVSGAVAKSLAKHARLESSVRRHGHGFGIERCGYELNPELACQSPIVAPTAAFDGVALLRALEARADGDTELFDQHIAAFIGSRLGDFGDRVLNDLAAASGDRAASAVARLRLLAAVALGAKLELPRLCRQWAQRLQAVPKAMHNRKLREKVTKLLAQAGETGSLPALVAVVADNRLTVADRQGFAQARTHYQALATALVNLKKAEEFRAPRADRLGHVWAATSACIGSVVFVAAYVILFAV